MLNNLQVQRAGRKCPNPVGADFAVEENHRTVVLKKADWRTQRQSSTTTSRVRRCASTRPRGERPSHKRGIEPGVIDRPVVSLHSLHESIGPLPFIGDHTEQGRG